MEPTPTLARRLWKAIEPIHAVVYFAPEPAEAVRKVGLTFIAAGAITREIIQPPWGWSDEVQS
jgi:hypothetical protein